MKDEIKQVFVEHANDNGLPIFGEEWLEFTGAYKTPRQELVKSNQAIEKAVRNAEITKLNKIYAETKRQGRIMSNYYKQGYNKVRFHKRFEKIEKYGSLTARGRY